MIVHDVEQRSEAWHRLRAGRVTGSAANAILAVRQKGTGELAIRRDLRQRLIVESITGNPMEENGYKSKAMEHGIDCEQEALNAYEAATGEIVTRVGFVSHDTLMAGCSPDGRVGEWDGAIELKCPNSDTHLEYLQADVIPKEYYGQVLHTLWITGAPWVDFCSYDPRYPEPMRLFRKRLTREGIDFTAYELAVSTLLTEVEHAVAKMQPEDVHAF